MTHRVDLVWLDLKDDLNTVKEKIQKEVHSVYPVSDGQIDNLVGIFSVKDVFPLELNNETFRLEAHLHKPLIIVENTPAFKMLEHFKEKKFHYGIVVDEYGSIKGMVAMDDVVDALLGEVSEYNQKEYQIIKRDEHTWLADAQVPYFVFLEYFDINKKEASDNGFNTLAGLILNKLQHIPVVGEKVKWHNFEFEIIDVDGTRIDKILIYKKTS
jgi:putative hemolysin